MQLVSMMLEGLSPKDLNEEGKLNTLIRTLRRNLKISFGGQMAHPDHQAHEKPFNLNFPNLSALLSVAKVLRFLGPTDFVDTMTVSKLQSSISDCHSTSQCIMNGDWLTMLSMGTTTIGT